MKMKYCIVILCCLIILNGSSVLAGGLGISPSVFDYDDFAKGNSYEAYSRVLNLENVNRDIHIDAIGTGSQWIKIMDAVTNETYGVYTIPGKSDRQFTVIFDIPNDAPNGFYEGYLQVEPTTTEGDGNVNIVVRSYYKFLVGGNEVINGSVKSISSRNTEAGQTLRIVYDFTNSGNTQVAPFAHVQIFKDGNKIDEVRIDGSMVKAKTTSTQEILWNTSNRGTGNFSANVKIFLDNESIFNEDLEFYLENVGTFLAEAIVGEVALPDVWSIEEVGKIEVTYFNIGNIDFNAKLVSEVWKNDKLIDVLNSDGVLIKAGTSEDILLYYKPENNGDYTLKNKVVYSGKEEILEDISINVFDEDSNNVNTTEFTDESSGYINVVLIVNILILLIAVIFIVMLFTKSKNNR